MTLKKSTITIIAEIVILFLKHFENIKDVLEFLEHKIFNVFYHKIACSL